jgi:hypothetical protein
MSLGNPGGTFAGRLALSLWLRIRARGGRASNSVVPYEQLYLCSVHARFFAELRDSVEPNTDRSGAHTDSFESL